MSNHVYLDFEYNQTTEKYLNLVCCSLYYCGQWEEYWLHNDLENKRRLLSRIKELYDFGGYFISFNVQAEARAIISLMNDCEMSSYDFVREIPFIDLYLEWKCLTNHNNKLAYGKQLIKGKVVNTVPPKPKFLRTEEELGNKSKAETNLAAMTYKLLGIQIDTEHKTKMRDLIISNPKTFSASERKSIMDYCTEDVNHLESLFKRVAQEYYNAVVLKPGSKKKQRPGGFDRWKKIYTTLIDEMKLRAEYSVATAIMETLGYPINLEATKNFSDSVSSILNEICLDIIRQFPDIKPFRYNHRSDSYSMNQNNVRDWISKQNLNWLKTATGKHSIALDAFKQHWSGRHEYPRGNFIAQMVRYLSIKQSLNGFMPIKPGQKRKSFWESVGSDGRVRPFFNIYGSQSARSQPSATGFIPLKSAWMRSLITSNPGKAICGIDYGSQEFLISALLSNDKVMIDAYRSGDVYLYFAKQIGLVPQDGTRAEYKKQRDRCKSTVLGISYDMTNIGLSKKLTADIKELVSEDEAQELINNFYETFENFKYWKEETKIKYSKQGYLRLPCGWFMWGNNPNERSVGNFPVQGTGSSIMRRAVKLAQDAGLDVIYTLHDAIYIEYNSRAYGSIDCLAECMRQAFVDIFEGNKDAELIRLDANTWSPDYDDEIFTIRDMEVKQQNIYIDERSKAEYERFSKYFKDSGESLL